MPTSDDIPMSPPLRLDPEGDFTVQREAVRQALIEVEQRADAWYHGGSRG